MADNTESEVLRLRRQVSQLENTVRVQQAELDSLKTIHNTHTNHHLLWRGCPPLQCGVVRPHLVTLGNEVYVGGGNTRTLEMSRRIHKYVVDGVTNKWESLPITPHITFSLAVINDCVTVIGGVNIVSSLTSADLLNYDANSKKWKKTFPAMPTRRCATSAIATACHVIVTGGIHQDGSSYLSVVEVLDKGTLQWSTAHPIPKPTAFMSITAGDLTGRIYLLGGLTKQGSIRSIFSCILTELIQSTVEKEASSNVWEEIAQAPYHRMGCIAMSGKLIVASGMNEKDKITASVHSLDPITREWSNLGNMAAARSSCSLTSVAEGRMIVIGGYMNPHNWMTSLTTDVMECVNMQVD